MDDLMHALDAAAIGTAIATLFALLPPATALLSFVYLALRVYETKTVQRWLGRKE